MKRLGAVVVISLTGFIIALVAFSGEAPPSCVADAPPDTRYSAQLAGPLALGDRTHQLEVSRDGQPLSGARVCLNAQLEGRPQTSVTSEAKEIGRGRYELDAEFPRAGRWEGRVLVGPGTETVEAVVPVRFEVTS